VVLVPTAIVTLKVEVLHVASLKNPKGPGPGELELRFTVKGPETFKAVVPSDSRLCTVMAGEHWVELAVNAVLLKMSLGAPLMVSVCAAKLAALAASVAVIVGVPPWVSL